MKTLKQKLDELVFNALEELNDYTDDDTLVELSEDFESKSNAIDYLIEILEEIRNE